MIVLVPLLGALGVILIFEGLTSTGTRGDASSFLTRLDRLAREAGMRKVSGPGLIAASAAATVLTAVVVAGITSSGVIALTLAAGAAVVPFSIVRSRRRARLRRLREGWPDAISTLVAAVRAGVALPEACASLAERCPEGLREGFRGFEGSYRASGSFNASLQRLRDELMDPVADRVVAALQIAHEVGGTDLVRVLRTLGDFVREDLRVRKEIEARWSWTVTAARVAAAAPWIVLLMMSTRPEAAAAYNSATGALVIMGGGAATLLGYRLMLRAARLPDERRLTG